MTGVWAPARRLLTVGLVTTVTLIAFEALAVGTVMPLVVGELGGLSLYGWAFSGFFLGNLIGIVAAGGAIDRGHIRLAFLAGLVLFGVGLLLGGLAPSMPVLVVGRIIQGLGAGGIPPIAYVAISRGYADRIRPRMFAILSTAWVVPGLVGPAVAGWVGDHLTWRFVFLGLLPLIAACGMATLIALRAVPDPVEDAGTASRRGADARRRLLLAGLVTAAAAMLLVASTSGSALVGLPLAAAGLAFGVPALLRLLPPGTLRGARGLPAAVLCRGVLTFAFFGAGAYLPLALVAVRHTSATEAGLVLTGSTLSWTAGSWVQAHRNAAWGGRRLVRLGFGFLAVGLVSSASVLVPGVPVLLAVATWAVAGFGMGLAYSSVALLVIRGATPSQEGAATAALQLSDVLGTSLGTGLGGAIVAFAQLQGSPIALGIAAAFGVSVAAALGGTLLSGRLSGERASASLSAVASSERAVTPP